MRDLICRLFWLLFKKAWICRLVVLLALSSPLTSFAQEFPLGFQAEIIAEGLNPTQMVMAPDGRLFVTEKNGTIRVIEDDVLQPQIFLSLDVEQFNERGLLGIEFDPNFENSNHFFVYYTVLGETYNRISRFTSNGPVALPSSEEILMNLDPLAGAYHNGGVMRVGLDGQLYVGVGDGGASGNSQNMSKLLGKVLRMTLDGEVPSDNPYVGEFQGRSRYIYAAGLRNPYTMDMHRDSGMILVNDVGGGQWEEVNELFPHVNYGWNLIEGFIGSEAPPADYMDPLYAYSHSFGCAITGSSFYDPVFYAFPELYHDSYLFADYCSGYIKVLNPATGSLMATFATGLEQPIGLEVDESGSLYVLERNGIGGGSTSDNGGSENGRVWKVTYTGSGTPYIIQQPESKIANVGETVSFEVTAGGARELSYQWIVNGASAMGGVNEQFDLEILLDASYEVYCVISNSEGTITTDTVSVTITDNLRPEVSIDAPSMGSFYEAGETIVFSGAASDVEDGSLPESALIWWIDFHHNVHTHPFLAPTAGVNSIEVTIPTVGETSTDVWYRAYLQATDSEGRSNVTTVDLVPRIGVIELATSPDHLPLLIDGELINEAVTLPSVIGIDRSIIAPPTESSEEWIYYFDEWNTGSEENILNIQAEETPGSYTAKYDSLRLDDGIGLAGSYYENFSGEYSGQPSFQRIDSLIDFSWGAGAPIEGMAVDSFGVRWEGFLKPIFDGPHELFILADDGGRVYMNDGLIIDAWQGASGTERSAEVILQKDVQYSIVVEMRDKIYSSSVRLSWKHESLPYERIRTSQLNPTPFPETPDIGDLVEFTSAYPNPTEDFLTITHVDNPTNIYVVDPAGRIIELPVQRSFTTTIIDVRSLTSGTYSLVVSFADYTNHQRFVKL